MSSVAAPPEVRLDFDFECASGDHLRYPGAGHAAFDAKVDGKGLRYFAVRVQPCDWSETVRIDVYADPTFPDMTWQQGPFGRPVWVCSTTGSDWRRLAAERIELVADGRILRLTLSPQEIGAGVFVAGAPFVRWSQLRTWANDLAVCHPGRVSRDSLGYSTEGRELIRLTLRAPEIAVARPTNEAHETRRPQVVIFGAEHGIEFEGVHACMAIAERALEPDCTWLHHIDLSILPSVNPDGMVGGWAQFNAHDRAEVIAGRANPHTEDVSWHHDYRFLDGVAGRAEPDRASPEARQLWDFLRAAPPRVLLMFHSWSGKLCQGAFRATTEFFPFTQRIVLPAWDAAVAAGMKPDPEFVGRLDWEPTTTSETKVLCPGHVQDYLARDFGTYGTAPEFEAGLPPASHRRCGIKTVDGLVRLIAAGRELSND